MRANEFLAEMYADETPDQKWDRLQIDKLIDALRTNCAPYFKETNRIMYRGINAARMPDLVSVASTSKERFPRDTPNILNQFIVEWFEQNVGIPYRKEHTLFATGSRLEADGYGAAFMVFPIGEFEYCWSPVHSDLTDALASMSGNSLRMDEIKTSVYKVMNRGQYEFNFDLTSAIDSKNEIMIYCKQYYAINFHSLTVDYRTKIDFNLFKAELFR